MSERVETRVIAYVYVCSLFDFELKTEAVLDQFTIAYGF